MGIRHTHRSLITALGLTALLGMGLGACAPNGAFPISIKREQASDLHERLSQAIRRNGFSHGLRGVREDNKVIDTIFISVSFDAMKRRYAGLDKMLAEVGRICGDKAFENFTIRVELSGDDDDMIYLRGLLEPGIAGAKNVSIVSVNEGRNDIVITTSRAESD